MFEKILQKIKIGSCKTKVSDDVNAFKESDKKQDTTTNKGGGSSIPILEVWNKWDLLDEDRAEELSNNAASSDDIVPVSAISGEGVDELLEKLGEMLTVKASIHEFELSASDGRRIAWLHAHGEVLVEEDAGEGKAGPQRRFIVRLNPKELGQFETL